MKIKHILLSLFTIAVLFSCTDSEDDDVARSDNFDRKALLENIADNIIIPAFQDLSNELNSLKASKDNFIATPNQVHLDDLRIKWLDAYQTWQTVEIFNIGKAEEIQYLFQMNIYPTTVSDVQNNIASGSYDLTNPSFNDAVGFPAVEYMLYGIASDDASIIAAYTTGTNSQGHKNYLSDLVDQMDDLTRTVLTDWTSGYRDSFVNNTANNGTGSLNKLVNDFIFYYEKGLRANKVGIPAGIFSTAPIPTAVEGFYSNVYSKELALQALDATQDFFNGKHYNSGNTGVSLADYVTTLRTNSGSSDLTSAINNQFNTAREAMDLLDDNFANQVETENTKMLETYDELQRNVVLIKVDMIQTLDISIDFVDSDGD